MNVLQRHEDAEISVIGAVLRDYRSAAELMLEVSVEDFYSQRHQMIWEVVCELSHESVPVDLVTLGERLKRAKWLDSVGGEAYLMDLCDSVVSAAGAVAHARIVHGDALVRMAVKQAYDLIEATKDGCSDPMEVLELVNANSAAVIQAAAPRGSGGGEMASVAGQILTNNRPHVMRTGYEFLDKGLAIRPTNLTIIAGTPGTGKTSLAIGIARHVSGPTPAGGTGAQVLFSNLEMSIEEMTESVMSQATAIPLDAIANRRLHQEEMERCRMATILHRIRFQPCPTVGRLYATARAMKASLAGLGLIVVDYLQLMNVPQASKGSSRNDAVAEISRGLKMMGMELQVPVIALSQLSREAVRSGKPALHHLRDSGAIEQDANQVVLLSRPQECYPNILVDVAKNRRGATFESHAGFAGPLARFHDLGRDPFEAFI